MGLRSCDIHCSRTLSRCTRTCTSFFNTSLAGELQDRDRMLKVRRRGRNRAAGAHFSSAQGAVRHRTFSSDSITIYTHCEPPSGCAGQRAVVGGTSGSNLMAPL